MACSCNKGVKYKSRTPIVRSITSARSTQGGIAASMSPTQQRAQQAIPPQQPLNQGGIAAEKRKVQALRRNAIRKAFNK